MMEASEALDKYEDFNRGKRDGMLEVAMSDLEASAMRIAVLEEDLAAERRKKWEIVRKISLLESGEDFKVCLEPAEPLTLHEKIDLIKSGFAS